MTPPPPPPSLLDTNATAATAAPVPPPPPPPARPRPSSARQALAVAGIVILLGLLIGGGYLLWQSWSQRKAAPAVAVDATPAPPVQVSPPPVAVTPEPAPAVPQDATAIIARQLEIAGQALAAKQYDGAITGARSVLMIDPGNVAAADILAKATKAQARAKQKPEQTPREIRPGDQVAVTPAVPETPVGPSPSQPPPPEATTATLRIHAVSEFAGGGVLIVYVGDREKARYSFSGWGSVFRRRPERLPELSKSLEVPAGTVSLRVYVAPGGQSAQVRPLSGNFPGGGSRLLEVRLSAEGQVEANLR